MLGGVGGTTAPSQQVSRYPLHIYPTPAQNSELQRQPDDSIGCEGSTELSIIHRAVPEIRPEVQPPVHMGVLDL